MGDRGGQFEARVVAVRIPVTSDGFDPAEVAVTEPGDVEVVLRPVNFADSLVVTATHRAERLPSAVSGSDASRTLVLADGVPLNDPFGSWVY